MKYDSVLDIIGYTPLIKLNRIAPKDGANIYVKFEGLNLGGSIKTRTACNMIIDAVRKGLITKETTIVEATSGNQGIGISLVCAVLGYKALIIMPDSVSEERRKTIKQYGAELILVHDDGDIGKCIQECKDKATELDKQEGYFALGQFDNMANVYAQKQTGEEIIMDLPQVDGFCSGFGTGGTITGVGEVLKRQNPNVKIWVIEPENAAILSNKPITSHLQMGIGDGLIPSIMNQDIYDKVVILSDDKAIEMAKRLAKEEGLLCGITGGTNVAIAVEMAKELGPGKNVVTILPDIGERYFSTPLFD